MEKIKELISKCKFSVDIFINNHRDCFESVVEHINDKQDEISPEVLEKMIELNTIIEIIFHPKNQVGCYVIYHYDICIAVEECIEICN